MGYNIDQKYSTNFLPILSPVIPDVMYPARINAAVINLPKKQVRLEFRPKMLVINRPAMDRFIT